jgi:hypothetical protein
MLRRGPWVPTLVVATILFVQVLPAEADTLTTINPTLPTHRDGMASVWTGTSAYIIGGDSPAGRLSQIVRFTPPSTVTTVTPMPGPRGTPSAVWTGSYIYIFGGYNAGVEYNTIFRYDPATDTIATMSATIPVGSDRSTAVWDGTNAYIFGGYTGTAFMDSIVRYNPATNTVTTMATRLPTARDRLAGFWDGTYIYLVGGGSAAGELAQILRYNPATDTLTTLGATLPTPREGHTLAWDGSTHAYIFGGRSAGVSRTSVVRFTPGTGAITTMGPTTDRTFASAVWTGSSAYIFGGGVASGGVGGFLNDILRYDPDGCGIVTARHQDAAPSWLFGQDSQPPGIYNVTYVGGAIRFSPSGGWRAQHAEGTYDGPYERGFHIVTATGTQAHRLPGSATPYASQAQVQAASVGLKSTFAWPGGSMAIVLHDSPHSDNASGNPNPTWRVCFQSPLPVVPPPPPPPPPPSPPVAATPWVAGIGLALPYPGGVPEVRPPVANLPPVPVVELDLECPQSFQGTAGSSWDVDGLVVRVTWDFGDGSSAEGWEADHQYEVPGTYQVVVGVWDDQGAQGRWEKTITATPCKSPTPNARGPA